MAIKGVMVGLGLSLLLVLFHGAVAQSGCITALTGLTPCLSYVNGSSSAPSSTCCSQLSSVVNTQPQCLCLLLNNTASAYGYNINQTQALALPGVCNVQTPSISQCNAASPSVSPTSSPADSSSGNTPADTTPATTSNPTVPTGSKTVPTTTVGSPSDGSSRNIGAVSFCSIAIAVVLSASPYF